MRSEQRGPIILTCIVGAAAVLFAVATILAVMAASPARFVFPLAVIVCAYGVVDCCRALRHNDKRSRLKIAR